MQLGKTKMYDIKKIRAVVENDVLTPAEKNLWLLLYFTYKEEKFTGSVDGLAEIFNINRHTMVLNLQRLKRLGTLKSERIFGETGRGVAGSRYWLISPNKWDF
jgi:hypothetical protein